MPRGLVTPRLGGCICIRVAGPVATAVLPSTVRPPRGGRRKCLISLGESAIRPPVHRRVQTCAHGRVCGQAGACLRARVRAVFYFFLWSGWTDGQIEDWCGFAPSSPRPPVVHAVDLLGSWE